MNSNSMNSSYETRADEELAAAELLYSTGRTEASTYRVAVAHVNATLAVADQLDTLTKLLAERIHPEVWR